MPTRMEELASKGMGAAKGFKARIEGLHGVFKRLAEEHGEVTALLLRVKASDDVDVREKLFPEIRTQLLAHEKGEIREVYSEFEKRPELQPIVKSHDDEATELQAMLEELNQMPYTDAAWASKLDKLVELVNHHVDEEEGEYFPAGERVLGEEEANRLLSKYDATKSELLRQPM